MSGDLEVKKSENPRKISMKIVYYNRNAKVTHLNNQSLDYF